MNETSGLNEFNLWVKWIELQKLIKEEITLNEVVEKLQSDNLLFIKKNYFEFFQNKIKIREIYDFIQKMATNDLKIDQMEYELVNENEKVLLECNDLVNKLFGEFRKNYKFLLILVEIIEKSKHSKEDIDSIVELFTHNFFENHLIQNSENDEILIFIYLLLQREIDNMTSPSVFWFLSNDYSLAGKIIKSFTRKPEIKSFVSLILNEIILKIENSEQIFFELNPKKIEEYIKRKKLSKKTLKSFVTESSKNFISYENVNISQKIRRSVIDRSIQNLFINKSEDDRLSLSLMQDNMINTKDKKAPEDFFLEEYDYLPQNEYDSDHNPEYEIELTQEELSLRVHYEKDSNLKDFYIRQMNKIGNNNHIFTNKKLYEELHSISEFEQASKIYKRNFELLKDYCDEIFRNIIEKFNMMPYVIRCICKIIHLLITRKFPDINVFDRNSFIAEFIFEKWIMPVLFSPDYNTILTSTVISESTRKNLLHIAKIFRKINRSIFFESSNESQFTIFNHYIIEIMPSIILFYNKLIDVNLPKPIEEIFQSKEKNNISYNYFKENPDELVNIQNICFTTSDLLFLYNIIKQNLESFEENFLIRKIIDKMSFHEGFLNKLMKSKNRNFFLILLTEYNPEKKKILQPEIMRFTFNNDIATTEFRLKRIKFIIKLILRGINLIDTKICSYYSLFINTEKFFIILNKIIQVEEYSNLDFNQTIPLNWYSLYLNSNLILLNNEYRINDYKKLYDEILQDETKEIDFLNYKSQMVITKYGLNKRTIEKIIEKYKKDYFKIKQIEKFIKISYFMRYSKIEVCIRKNLKEDVNDYIASQSLFSKIFGIFSKPKKEKSNSMTLSQQKNDGTITVKRIDECIHKQLLFLLKLTDGKPRRSSTKEERIESHSSTIHEFIQVFSKFTEIKEDIKLGNNIHKIYEVIFSYLKIVKDCLLEHHLFKNLKDQEIDEIIEDIKTYIERKIYKKVYPVDTLEKDKEFYDKTCMFSWITPSHLDIKTKFINEGLWEIAINYLEKIDDEKSTRDKLNCVSSAYRLINNCIKFCSGKNENGGTEEIVDILIYIMIKTRPKRIFSNIHFIQTFIHPNDNSINGFLFQQMNFAVTIISKIDHNFLKMPIQEFEKYMETSKQRTSSNKRLRYSNTNEKYES